MREITRGSEKWIRKAVNEKTEFWNSVISHKLNLEPTEDIMWLSPLARDGYQEYFDQKFIELLDVKLNRRQLSDFWPKRGPHWDALGKTSMGKLLLVEAKAHIPEMNSDLKASSEKSKVIIENSFHEVKQYLGVSNNVDWTSKYYQYANRIAHLYLLRELNDLPAELLFLCFVNDQDMKGPTSSNQWESAIELVEEYLGLCKNHRLSEFVHHIYLDVQELTETTETGRFR